MFEGNRALLDERSSPQLIDALQRLVAQLENELSLLEPNQLRQRMEALDRLDANFPDTHQMVFGADSGEARLYRQARAIYGRLEAVNGELYRSIRYEIQRGVRPDTPLQWGHPSPWMADVVGLAPGIAYDYLDELLVGVLQFEQPNAGPVQRSPEMVFYQPTPARHIFGLMGIAALTPTDVLVDLGSGLGHVPLLVSICTSAHCIGIELEAAYVECARQSAQGLNLNKVTFIRQDARAADLSSGTVFYLYTPFMGSVLSAVLTLLRREAAKRQIRICTLGPCTTVIAEERWLEPAATPETDRIALFRSRE
jgi:hypothetical protein